MQRPIAKIWAEIEEAKAEARAIVEEGVRQHQHRTCDILVDTDGIVYKRGDWPDATPSSHIPIHREYIWWASSEKNWEGIWAASYLSRMDRREMEKWLKKAREKLHHVSVPLRKRVTINERMLADRVAVIENAIAADEADPTEVKKAIKAVKEMMNHLRGIEKELKMQVNLELTAFKR